MNRTKDEIKNAPVFDEAAYRDETYPSRLGGYYGEGGAGYRPYTERHDGRSQRTVMRRPATSRSGANTR